MRRDKYQYLFPWRPGNRFSLLIDGERIFPAMLDAIAHAQAYVLLEMYLFESGAVADRFVGACVAAARRGAAVHVLLDDYGALALQQADRTRLRQGGVKLTFYNPLRYGKLRRNLFRDHRKLLAVDGARAFVGGVGITDEFDRTRDPTHYWRETVIEVRGPCVADWEMLFATTWRNWSADPLPTLHAGAPTLHEGQRGRVAVTQGPGRLEIKRSFLKRVRGAAHRAWLATAYFVPSWKIQHALRHAIARGADARLLLPGPYTDHPGVRHAGRRFYSHLLRNGVRIFEYQPRFLHSKVLLCDDWVSIGSSNIDRWNFRWNLEANQEVDDPAFADAVRAMFETDFTAVKEYHFELWRRRPWYRRLAEYFYGRVDLWLERRGHQKGVRSSIDRDE